MKSFRDKLGSRSGIVSIFTVTMASFFLVMGLTALSLQDASIRDSTDVGRSSQARFLAQSALSEGRYYVNANPNWVGTSPEQMVTIENVTVGSYEYAVTKTGGNVYTLTGTGYIPNKAAPKKVSQSYTVTFRNPAPLTIFSDGFEANNLALWTVYQDNAAHILAAASNTAPKKGAFHARFYKTAASNNGTTNIAHLTSPVIDLSPYDKVILRFTYRLKTGNGPAFRVYQNSTGNAGDWVEIYSDQTSNTSDGYSKPSVQLSISPRTAVMQFRFQAELKQKTEEWYLDAIEISTPFVMFDTGLDT